MHQEDIFNEIARSTRGREFFDADRYSFRRLGKFDDEEFVRLTERLRVKKWRSENTARHRAEVKAWKKANPEKAKELRIKYELRHREALRAKGRKRAAARIQALRDDPKKWAEHRAKKRAAANARYATDEAYRTRMKDNARRRYEKIQAERKSR